MSGIEDRLYRIVITGLLATVAMYSLGMVLLVVSPSGDLWRMFMEAGTILLFSTPMVKVAAAFYMFRGRGEKANAITALLVLTFMLLSLVLGVFLRVRIK